MSPGRPTDYRPEFCDKVIELGRAGKSKAQIAASLDVARFTLDRWAEQYPSFCDALTRARDLALSWWEDKAQEGLQPDPGKGAFNASLWSRSMAARFPDDYREVTRQEQTGKDGTPIETKWTVEFVNATPEGKPKT